MTARHHLQKARQGMRVARRVRRGLAMLLRFSALRLTWSAALGNGRCFVRRGVLAALISAATTGACGEQVDVTGICMSVCDTCE